MPRSPKQRQLSVRIASLLRSGYVLGSFALLAPFAAQAGCDNLAPASGQTTTCDAAVPNPDPNPVVAAVGSSDVTVNVQTGASISVINAHGVTIRDQSLITNAGNISVTAGAFNGITSTGSGNTVANTATGTIFSQAGSGIAMQAGGTVVNDGTITAQTGTGVLFGGIAAGVLINRGTITGAAGGVTFGAGNDRLEMLGGAITGAVVQGDGADALVMTAGQLPSLNQGNGTDRVDISGGAIAGNIQQGSGIDDYLMTGGQVGSLSQGDNLDTFTMSDGRIVGAFEDGDRAAMTGGRIGRVDMKLDDNLFDMSGGTIDGNLVTGFGKDTILLSGGLIGGNISVSGGVDKVTITGGTVRGSVLMSFGNDVFTWDGGGVVNSTIDLAGDNDIAVLRNLDVDNLAVVPAIRGGAGNDNLTFDGVATNGVSRFLDWETIDVTNATQLTFDGSLFLGDVATAIGTLNVDASSILFGGGGGGRIEALSFGQLAQVNNAGQIDLTNGGTGPTDTFTIAGNYVGNNASLLLETALGDDSSASDKLVISLGNASGSTGLAVANAGGAGAATLQDGIMVVEAANGATTANGAFALNSTVAAGAFEYFLFKGGVSADTTENWYLRSTLVATPPSPNAPGPIPAPPPPAGPNTPLPIPSPTTPPPTPGATPATAPVGTVIPLYRIEAPTYAVVPPAIHELGLATLGTFHERQGEQALLQGDGALPAAWARVIGQDTEQNWSGTVSPTFDGTLWGMQIGADVFARQSESGHRDHAGLFIGRTRMDGDVRGFALGWNNLTVGEVEFDDSHLGVYWTHIAPSGAYLDGVIVGSRFDGDATSDRSVGVDIDGDGTMFSIEGGYPFALGENWALEPQAQVIWQQLSFDDQQDRFSTIAFDAEDAVTGRVGVRLIGKHENSWLQPYLKANYWHGFGGTDSVRFGTDLIDSEQRFNAFEFGGGLIARFSDKVSFYLTGDYMVDTGDEERKTFEGNLGMRITW